MITKVLVNGEISDGRIPVTDSSVLRGDGCFEVMRTYGGSIFALGDHLDRLAESARRMGLGFPERDSLVEWVSQVAADVPDGVIRVVLTRGSVVPGVDGEQLAIVFGHPIGRRQLRTRLHPVVAPWHSAGVEWALSGAKVTSYGPNVSATLEAEEAGSDNALLISSDGLVLEGPTFSVAWVFEGVLETPTLELGILDSITRRHVLQIATAENIDVIEGRWSLDRLAGSTEVMAWSTIREVQPVVQVGDWTWEPGPVTERLAFGFTALTG